MRPILKRDLKSNAVNEKSPSGAWPKRATDKKKHRGFEVTRGRKLKESKTRGARSSVKFKSKGALLGKIPKSVTVKKTAHTIRAESTIRNKKGVKFGGVHNVGGKVGRGSKIPARPHVYLSPKFLKTARERLAKHLVGTWKSA